MNEAQLKQLVEQGIAAEKEFTAAKERLGAIKKRLIAVAEGRKEDHLPTPGGGSSWLAVADDGSAARVTFPARSLKAKIDPSSKTGKKLMERFGCLVKELFEKRMVFVPVENFRALVRKSFRTDHAESLIKACETESEPTVSFETVARQEKEAA
jgi:hypothetical protein